MLWCCVFLGTACSGGGSSPAAPNPLASAVVSPRIEPAVTPTPTPAATPTTAGTPGIGMIRHVIVIMQENRSFDDLFNGFPGADTVASGPNEKGETIPLVASPLEIQYDPGHGYTDFQAAVDGGNMDGFNAESVLPNPGTTVPPDPAYQYVTPSDVAPYWAYAQKYALADRMFSSANSASFAQHLYLISGQSQNVVDIPVGTPGAAWGCDSLPGTTTTLVNAAGRLSPGPFPCFTYTTIAPLLDAAGVSWKYYAPAISTSGGIWSIFDAISPVRYGPDWGAHVISPETTIFGDLASGGLPSVSWVVPSFSNSDHPAGSVSNGPSWVASVVNAVGASPYWSSTAIFVSWDDWGGFYDHVPPPVYNSQGLGIRVPLIVISPYAKHGYVSHVQHETASTLRFIEERFGLPSLGGADARADDLLDLFDFTQTVTPLARVNAPRSLEEILNASRRDQGGRAPDTD